MSSDSAPSDADEATPGDGSAPEFGGNVFNQILELWVRPELERRGLEPSRPPSQALVILGGEQRLKVLLNDEFDWVAAVRATRPIAKGEAINRSDFSSLEALRPAVVDQDAGWIGYCTVGTELFVAFDFRRNRRRAHALLARGREFQGAAQWALSQAALGPAIDSAFAAAELAVTAQLLVFNHRAPRRHSARQAQWSGWTNLGNAPEGHARALAALGAARPAARYGEGPLPLSATQIGELIAQTGEMLDYAEAQVGKLHAPPDLPSGR